jgi:cytoskeletal protein RodZ
MLLGLFILITIFLARRQGGKRKVATSTSSSASKLKRAKVLTRRPKPIGTTKVPKLIESAEAAPSATETTPDISIEASADPVKEPESEKSSRTAKGAEPSSYNKAVEAIDYYNSDSKEEKNG